VRGCFFYSFFNKVCDNLYLDSLALRVAKVRIVLMKHSEAEERFFPLSPDRGTALVEFCIVLPILAILLIGVMDVGNLLNHYLVLTQDAAEIARYGSGIPDLEIGRSCQGYVTLPGYCTLGNGTGTKHQLLYDRAQRLMSISRLPMLPSSSFTYEIEHEASHDAVYVDINTTFKGFIPPFDNIPISVRSRSAYLY
jgi:hypothetical protein